MEAGRRGKRRGRKVGGKRKPNRGEDGRVEGERGKAGEKRRRWGKIVERQNKERAKEKEGETEGEYTKSGR